jgi:hypothetical protein
VTASLRLIALILLLAFVSQCEAQGVDAPNSSVSPSGGRFLVMLRMRPPHFRPGSGYAGSYGDGEGRSARWRTARRLAAQRGASIVDEWPMPLLGVDCYVMALSSSRSLDAVVAEISRSPDVSWAEPMHVYRGKGAAPDYRDPLYPVQPAAREWRLAELHRLSTGRNVRVAIIDSMVDKDQPDLAGQIDIVRNFVTGGASLPEDHGTAVAGIIVAKPNNGVGIVGIAPQARLMALRACWQERDQPDMATLCDDLSLAKALQFAIENDAQIINLSLSGPADLLLSRLIDVAISHGIAVVAAYDRGAINGGFPASYTGVIAVVDEAPGPLIPGAVAAPGRDVPTTEPGQRWHVVNGSSYAAAHVSGLLALLRQRTALPHPAEALVVARLDNSVDACATLLQRTDAGGSGCAQLHEVLLSIANE